MGTPKDKRRTLQEAGALNHHPEAVQAADFQGHPFFDPEDKAQVKYEMLRCRELDGEPLGDTCGRFGFSRESYRQILERFRSDGILGLFDRKRGRKKPLKVDEKVRTFLHREHEKQPDLSADDLARRCEEGTGVSLSRRTVYRALAESQQRKKKRRRKQSMPPRA